MCRICKNGHIYKHIGGDLPFLVMVIELSKGRRGEVNPLVIRRKRLLVNQQVKKFEETVKFKHNRMTIWRSATRTQYNDTEKDRIKEINGM